MAEHRRLASPATLFWRFMNSVFGLLSFNFHSPVPSSNTKQSSGTCEMSGLPKRPTSAHAYVSIKPFETGRMVTPAATLVEDAQGHSMATSWRFLLTHTKSDTHFWFDMGISHDLSSYIPSIQAVHAHFKPIPSPTSITEDTIASSISPAAISHIILSHAHWDHVSPMPPEFTTANLIVGAGLPAHCAPGYPTCPTSKFDSKIWDPALRTFSLRELPSTTDTTFWKPLGPFPAAYDFFGDASFYLLDAPGHMVGNLAALCRVATKAGSWKWVLLGGDCAHCSLFTYWPQAPFGKMPKALFPSGSLHECGETARKTIGWIADAKRAEGEDLLVWYAHADFLEGAWEL